MDIESSGHIVKFDKKAFKFRTYFDEGEPDEDAEVDDDEDVDGSESGSSGTDRKEVNDPDKKRLSSEAAKYRVEARKERKLREEMEARVKELEDKDKDEVEKLRSDFESSSKTNSELKDRNVSLMLENAALRSASKFNFRDIDDAMKFAVEGSDIQGDEDNLDELVAEALEKLAKEKPYLLKPDDDGDDADDQDDSLPSGRQTNGKKKGKQGLDEETLLKKFPALQR